MIRNHYTCTLSKKRFFFFFFLKTSKTLSKKHITQLYLKFAMELVKREKQNNNNLKQLSDTVLSKMVICFATNSTFQN